MKAHRTDGLSLSFSVIFFAIFAWWVVAQAIDLRLPEAGWFVAGALIILGLLGLVGAIRSARNATLAQERAAMERAAQEQAAAEKVLAEAAAAEASTAELAAMSPTTAVPLESDDAVDPYASIDLDRPADRDVTAELDHPVSPPPRDSGGRV